MEREAIIIYGTLKYTGLDADGHIHIILEKGKEADPYIMMLKEHEGKSCMVKIAPIKRKNV